MSQGPWRLQPEHVRSMQVHVAQLAPLEACGLVAGAAGLSHQVYPVTNVAASPTRYRMAPAEQVAALTAMQAHGWELLAIFHSHPAGPATPSPRDVAEALYPGALHLIWAPGAAGWAYRAFLLDGGQPTEIDLHDETTA